MLHLFQEMTADAFERRMIRHHLQQSPTMTLHGITILIVPILTIIYAAMDCGFFGFRAPFF